MARIFIGIPCYDKVAPEVLEDYMRFAFYLGRRYQEHDFFLGIKTKSEQFRARNAIVEGAYQTGCDYLLMIDDDHIIDIDGRNYAVDKYEFLRKLINHLEQDKKLGLVGALYYHRGGQCRPVILVKEEKGNNYRYLKDDEIIGDLQEVDIQGGGIMLIRMTALDFIGSPWFEPETEYGTDFQICKKMAAAGFKVACDTSIEIGHLAYEHKIVSSKNRHRIQSDSAKLSKDLEISNRLAPIYREFQAEVMEYLNLNNLSQLLILASQYNQHRGKFAEYADKMQYYRDAGRPYLARAAMLAKLDDNWPVQSDDFLLRTLRTGVPAIGVDYGCGAGRISYEFAKAGHLIHFIDLDGVETFEFLKWRCQKNHVMAKFNEWPVPNSADYVLAHDIFEHLGDISIPLIQLCRCLKPGGILITNYMLMTDWANPEHINNNKPLFLEILKSQNMQTVNSCVYQKMGLSA